MVLEEKPELGQATYALQKRATHRYYFLYLSLAQEDYKLPPSRVSLWIATHDTPFATKTIVPRIVVFLKFMFLKLNLSIRENSGGCHLHLHCNFAWYVWAVKTTGRQKWALFAHTESQLRQKEQERRDYRVQTGHWKHIWGRSRDTEKLCSCHRRFFFNYSYIFKYSKNLFLLFPTSEWNKFLQILSLKKRWRWVLPFFRKTFFRWRASTTISSLLTPSSALSTVQPWWSPGKENCSIPIVGLIHRQQIHGYSTFC